MTINDDRELVRAVGKLEGTVKSLVETWAEQDRQATEGRRQLYARVGEMGDRIARLSERIGDMGALREEVNAIKETVRPLVDTVQRIEPIVTRLDRAHSRGEGVMTIGRSLWVIVGGSIGAATVKVIDLLTMRPHP